MKRRSDPYANERKKLYNLLLKTTSVDDFLNICSKTTIKEESHSGSWNINFWPHCWDKLNMLKTDDRNREQVDGQIKITNEKYVFPYHDKSNYVVSNEKYPHSGSRIYDRGYIHYSAKFTFPFEIIETKNYSKQREMFGDDSLARRLYKRPSPLRIINVLRDTEPKFLSSNKTIVSDTGIIEDNGREHYYEYSFNLLTKQRTKPGHSYTYFSTMNKRLGVGCRFL